MNVAGTLTFDDGRVVVGDAQRDFHAQFLGEIVHERRPALGDARGVFRRNDREGQFGISSFPVLGGSRGRERERGGAGKNQSASDHDSLFIGSGRLTKNWWVLRRRP